MTLILLCFNVRVTPRAVKFHRVWDSGAADHVLDAPVFYQCCDLYGMKTCGKHLSDNDKVRIAVLKKKLATCYNMEAVRIGGLEAQRLITITAPAGPAAHDDSAGGAQQTVHNNNNEGAKYIPNKWPTTCETIISDGDWFITFVCIPHIYFSTLSSYW